MRAAVYEKFGPPEVIEIRELPKPQPSPKQIVICVRATPVTFGDYRLRKKDLPDGMNWAGSLILGKDNPRIPVLGLFFAGEVVETGAGVTQFKPGDRVFGTPGGRMGCHAEYVVANESGAVVAMPDALSFEDAAAITFGGTTGLYFFSKSAPAPGDRVLVNGASGSVGAAMLQQAKALGAEVAAVCSGRNADFVKELGADHLIDYTQQDFMAAGLAYDMVIDCVGNIGVQQLGSILKKGGVFHQVIAGLGEMLRGALPGFHGSFRVYTGSGTPSRDQLELLGTQVVRGDLQPTIEKVYPFEEIVAAHAHVGTRRKRGNVVLKIG